VGARSPAAPDLNRYSYTLTAPSSATSLRLPALSTSLAAFRLTTYSTLMLQTLKYGGSVGYSDYQQAVDAHQGRPHEASGFEGYSYARVSRVP